MNAHTARTSIGCATDISSSTSTRTLKELALASRYLARISPVYSRLIQVSPGRKIPFASSASARFLFPLFSECSSRRSPPMRWHSFYAFLSPADLSAGINHLNPSLSSLFWTSKIPSDREALHKSIVANSIPSISSSLLGLFL